MLQKTVIIGIKILKIYCKANLDAFYKKCYAFDTKKIFIYDRFFVTWTKFYYLTWQKKSF